MSVPSLTTSAGMAVARMPPDVDAANAGMLGEQLAGAVAHDGVGLVIDLSETRFLDSAGIDMLLMLDENLRARRQTLRLVLAADSPIRRLLQIVGVDRAVAIHEDIREVR